MKRTIITFLSLILLFSATGTSLAAPILWEDNGHYYEYIAFNGTWDQANADAINRSYLGMDGHLATLTSEAENIFVWNAFEKNRAWLGGFQTGTPNPADEPYGSWTWVTGEAWDYTNWAGGEPNDYGGSEDYLHFWNNNGTWNDIFTWQTENGYIIEYDTNPVPEPGTMALLGVGLLGIAGIVRKRKGN